MSKIKAIVAAFCLLLAGAANAVIISNATPIPDANVLLNFNGSGLDWVYAGPIAPNEFGPGQIQPASYRAAEGWRTATAAEWAARPDWDDFIIAPNPVLPNAGHTDHSVYRFASEYWGDFSHVDLNDYFDGIVTDGVNGPTSGVPETIYVRNSLAVPAPGTLLLMGLSLFGLMAFSRRRR